MRRSERTSATQTLQLNKEDFEASWVQVPKKTLTPPQHALETARVVLENVDEDWNRRCEQLKMVRAVVLNSNEEVRKEILPDLHLLNDALDKSVRDLRSAIVKEAALTTSFLVNYYRMDMRALGELCLPATFAQVAVSTKIIALNAAMLSQFIVENVQSKQIFSTVTSFITSKDKNQRKQSVILVSVILSTWDEKLKNSLMRQICELIKSAIHDADSNTRVAGRQAFQVLEKINPKEADNLFKSVDASKQKLLRAPNGGSSVTSLHEDQGNVPFRSGFGSLGAKTGASFLLKRSSSATEQLTDMSPGGSKFTRPSMIRTTSSIRSVIPTPSVKSRFSGPSSTTQRPRPTPSSGIQRVKSTLGPDSFCASLSAKQATELEKSMQIAKESLCQPANDDDDDFLLPKREKKNNELDRAIQTATSSNPTIKREGIQMLHSLIENSTLSPEDVTKVGEVLIRLAAEVSSPFIFNVINIFVAKYSSQLSTWLVPGLLQLLGMTETLDVSRKKHVEQCLQCIQQAFEIGTQFKALAEVINSRVLPMKSSTRIPFLNHLLNILESKSISAEELNTTDLRKILLKTLDWMMLEQKLQQVGDKVLRAVFLQSAEAYIEILQNVDQKFHFFVNRHLPNPIEKMAENSPRNSPKPQMKSRRSAPLYMSPHVHTPSPKSNIAKFEPLREINSQLSNVRISSPRPPVQHRSDTDEVIAIIDLMASTDEVSVMSGVSKLHEMIIGGRFTHWGEYFPTIQESLFRLISVPNGNMHSEEIKKRSLRVLVKVCHVRSSALFDSTDACIQNVLAVAIGSHEMTTKIASVECLKTLSTHLPVNKVADTYRENLQKENEDRRVIVLKMVAKMYKKLEDYELKDSVEKLAPVVVNIFASSKPDAPRKAAAHTLNIMRTKMGDETMKPYLVDLARAKRELLERFAAREQSDT